MDVVVEGIGILRHPSVGLILHRRQLGVHLKLFEILRKLFGNPIGIPPEDSVVWHAEQIAFVCRKDMATLVIGWFVAVRVVEPVDGKHVGSPHFRSVPQNNLGSVIPKKAVLADGHVLREAVPKLLVVKRNVVIRLMHVDLGYGNSAANHARVSHNMEGQDRAGVRLKCENIHIVEFVPVSVVFGEE